jgi:hypothetical protein
MSNSGFAKLTSALIAAWFVFAVIASARQLFTGDPGMPPIALGLAAVLPVVLFLLWFAASQSFRRFALSLDPRILTFVQSWRIAGYVFLALASVNALPVAFAWPAGWGDFFIGLTAPLAALKLANPQRRQAFLIWQALGITDLVLAVTLGATVSMIQPHGIPTTLMTELPLSMIPTFGVPLFLILHVISIQQARQWAPATGQRLQVAVR